MDFKSALTSLGMRCTPSWKVFLLKLPTVKDMKKSWKFIVHFYKKDFNPEQLKLHLNILSCNRPPISSPHNLAAICSI